MKLDLEFKLSIMFFLIGIFMLVGGAIIAHYMVSSYQQGIDVSALGLLLIVIVMVIGLVLASLFQVFGSIIAQWIAEGKIDWNK